MGALIGAVTIVGLAPATVAASSVAIVSWALAGVLATRFRRDARFGPMVVGVALAGALALGVALWAEPGPDGSDPARALAATLLAGLTALALVAAPDGRVVTRDRRRVVVAVAALTAIAAGVLAVGVVEPTFALVAGLLVVLGALALGVVVSACRRGDAVTRARAQWLAWGATVALSLSAWSVLVHALTGWPDRPGAIALASLTVVAVGIVGSTFDRLLRVVDRVSVHTIIALGLGAMVTVVYLITVLGLHGVPEDGEAAVLGLSLLAAAVVAVLVLPARRRLEAFAARKVYGGDDPPDEALDTFASRMSRAVPMDELLLQLAESLKRSMKLTAAEVWTGSDGHYVRAVSVPGRGAAELSLAPDAAAVAARAHVQGNAWLAVWIPELASGRDAIGRDDVAVRFTSVAHLGELLGFIVTERPVSEAPLDDDDERQVLVDIARQLGLALHNVRLDTALQASLERVQAANRELVASRARIVAATDESRRRIERDLHDGAQQHLVALAVKVGLVRQLLDVERDTATAMLEELRDDVQAALVELRELAHGIYPPLLRDRGLGEALRAAAQRATVAVCVDTGQLGRYGAEIETAVYFCCLEAIQNASKHAGDAATATVRVCDDGESLWFEVADDGAGFDVAGTANHGFVNMRDRLGAFDGELDVSSSPGRGTTVRGRIPLVGDAGTIDEAGD